MAFIRSLMLVSLLNAAGDTGGAGGGDTGATGATGAADPPKPFAVFHSSEQLDKRLKQSSKATLRELFGTDDEDLIKARWAKAADLEAKEEERRLAQLSEIERKEADRAREKQRADEAELQLEQERLDRRIVEVCLKTGIKNVGYAKFLISEGTSALAAGEQIELEPFLKKQLEDERSRAALGIDSPVIQVDDPQTTLPTPDRAPPAPPKPGEIPPPKTAMELSDQEWQVKRQSLGI